MSSIGSEADRPGRTGRRRLMLPQRIGRRGRGLSLGAAAFWLAAGATLLAEILVERRRGLFLVSARRHFFSLETPGEIALFCAALAAAHLALLYLLYRLLRLVPRRRPGLLAYDFLCVVGLAWLAALAVKSRRIAFFSGRLDLDLARELGGGRLTGALVYAADEALLLALGLLPPVGVALILRRWLDVAPPRATPAPRRRIAVHAAGAAAVVALLFAAASVPPVNFQLRRFSAPWLLLAGFDAATDPDRDGYGLFAGPRDPYPLDPTRHPMALDVPGNGVDEDGFGGDFVYAPEPPEPVPVFRGTRRHVVLVVLESTRADAVGKRWGGRLVAPNLTALAASGSAAPEAYSNFALTARSLKTLFTGRIFPAPGASSLFRDFRAAGYRIGVFSSQAENFAGIAEVTGMRANADILVDAESISAAAGESGFDMRLAVDGRAVLAELDRRLGDDWSQPTFLYVNFQPPHFPYTSPHTPDILPGRGIRRNEISAANRERVIRNYWNSVAHADALLGALLGRLQRAGVLDETIVVVVGDHGEAMFEQGYVGHGVALDRHQTQVPLVFSRPTPLPPVVGMEDVRLLILRAAGADVPPPRAEPVLQILGYFSRPALIAAVGPGGRRIGYAPATGEVTTGAGGSVALSDLPPGHPLRAQVSRLVDSWMAARWEQHLTARAACGRAWSHGVGGAYEVDRRRLCGE